MTAKRQRLLHLYTACVVAVSVVSVLLALRYSPPNTLMMLLVLAALYYLAEWMSFELPIIGSVSLGFAVVLSSVLLVGPAGAALVAIAGAIPPQDVRDKKPIARLLFNAGQLTLSAVSAGYAYLIAARSLQIREPMLPLDSLDLPRGLLAVAAAALCLFLMNAVLVSAFIAIANGMPIVRVIGMNVRSFVLSFLVLGILAFLLAQLGIVGALLIGLPLLTARQTFQVYLRLSEAYSQTVRCLVTAIEAKDVYTVGHSERVAQYCVQAATALRWSEQRVERIEIAALLHDLGKIGVSDRILSKPGKLTDEEFIQVQKHPDKAVELLADIEFLGDVVPFVHGHHERMDGRGYPKGVGGHSLPMESRLLAVADSLDAMTSERPYRPAMSFDEAARELRRVSGTQLDAGLVEVMLSVVDQELMKSEDVADEAV